MYQGRSIYNSFLCKYKVIITATLAMPSTYLAIKGDPASLISNICTYPKLFGSIFSFWICFTSDGLLAQRLTPNQEDQVICDRGFLPLAFDKSVSVNNHMNENSACR